MQSEREVLPIVNVQENISLDGTAQSMIKCSEKLCEHHDARLQHLESGYHSMGIDVCHCLTEHSKCEA